MDYIISEGTVNEFKISYNIDDIAISGDTRYYSETYAENLFTSFKIPHLNRKYIESDGTATSMSIENNPVSFDDNGFNWNDGEESEYFGHTVLLLNHNNIANPTSRHTISEVTDVQRLLFVPAVTKNTYTTPDGDIDYYYVNNETSTIRVYDRTNSGVIGTLNAFPMYTSQAKDNMVSSYINGTVLYNHLGIQSSGTSKYHKNYGDGDSNIDGITYFPTFDEQRYDCYHKNVTFYTRSSDGNYIMRVYANRYKNNSNNKFQSTIYIATEDELLNYIARFGLRFTYGGEIYYPVVEDGYITGYTDNISNSGDFKSWEKVHGHAPLIPPTPHGDEIIPMDFGTETGIHGATKYYVMDDAQLNTFMTALQDATAEHPDITNGFISCYYVPLECDNIVHSTNMPITVNNVTLTATGGKIITQKTVVLANFTVPKRHNNAFDTMTKYFIYTPFTDVIPLNYKCYGRNITVLLAPSVQDCTATIAVLCDGVMIYKQTVSIGSALSIALENNAEKSTAIVNACAKYTATTGGVVGGALTGNPLAVAGGAVGVVASTVNVLNAIGNTYIHSYGTTTGTALALNPREISLIEYVIKTDKPDNYESTVGNLVNKTVELVSGIGYTVLQNPRISCDLTALEKAELKSMLENGVIL